MSKDTMTISTQLTVVTCWCGMTYAIPQAIYDHMLHKRNNNERQSDTYCPLGHIWIITGKSDLDKERERAERLARQLANAEEDARSERASHIATKGQLTRARKRADRGVCQHCKRSFVNVARHVETCHPDKIEGQQRLLP
jgi:ABC-type siderophore export system fused ATPase/permease subunit